MPLTLETYKTLISNLPVRQQCFTTERKTWAKAEEQIEWLMDFNNNLFANKPSLTISRNDIFNTVNQRELIIKTIYWGYSSGMRGNHFINILKNIPQLENILSQLRDKVNPQVDDFEKASKIFKQIPGLGPSTYSKLLYFNQIKFSNNPCLILDRRLINVFRANIYIEFKTIDEIRYENAELKYLDFLHLTNLISKKNGTSPENIEQFIYLFGNSLK